MVIHTLAESADALLRGVPAGEAWLETGLGALRIRRIQHRRPYECLFHGPLCGLVLQGAKEVVTGGRRLALKPGDAMIVSHHIPAVSRVVEGTPTRPYLAALLPFDPLLMAELWHELRSSAPTARVAGAIETMKATPEIVDAFRRLLALTPGTAESRVLVSMVVKEIHLRLLMAPEGAILRNLLARDSQASRIGRAIAFIRRSDSQPISIDGLAEVAAMSTTSFHSHFKAVTGMTPLGFHKELRLMRARDMLADPERTVSSVAFAVGYESSTQFSREYARRFGAAPSIDRHNSAP